MGRQIGVRAGTAQRDPDGHAVRKALESPGTERPQAQVRRQSLSTEGVTLLEWAVEETEPLSQFNEP